MNTPVKRSVILNENRAKIKSSGDYMPIAVEELPGAIGD